MGEPRRGARRVPVAHGYDGDALIPRRIFRDEVGANGVVGGE